MKSAAFALLGAIVPLVTAHYTFPDLTVNGVKSGDWTYVRETANHYSNGPVTDVTSDAIRCYELDSTVAGSTQTAAVSAGSTLTMTANGPIYHNGAIFVYMSAVSSASSATAGTGQTWFKVYQNVPVYNSASNSLTFPSTTDATITFTVPKNVPSGQYLVRFEQIALHAASSFGGAQFYVGCAQINVSGGGSGTPGPLVSFPGAYTGNEPGIKIDIYNIPAGYAGYQAPGPAVWGGGSSGSQPSNTATATSTATSTRPTTTTKTTSSSSAPTTSSGSSSGAAQYAQCGGQGWTGATTCQSPYKCTAQSQYYSQCV